MTRRERLTNLVVGMVVGVVVAGVVFVWWRNGAGKNGAETETGVEETTVETVETTTEGREIVVDSPRPGEVVSSPLQVSGEAVGTWYFEAVFSGKVVDSKGRVLGEGIMTAQGEWMSEELVPFLGEIEFEGAETEVGKLVLERANPSGLPEYDQRIEIPIRFQ